MLERVLEPELMDDPEEAQLYDAMDHQTVNQSFVQDFLHFRNSAEEILDVGTGTAQIPIELCRRHASCRVMASDAAVSMLEVARINVAVEGMETRIQLHHGDAKQLEFADAMFDAVLSNSLLHHVPDPLVVLRELVRVLRPGGCLFVRDLMRPHSHAAVESLVKQYVRGEPPESQQLFRQSLEAALTLEEIRDCVAAAGFPRETVGATSDRHWTWAASKLDPA